MAAAVAQQPACTAAAIADVQSADPHDGGTTELPPRRGTLRRRRQPLREAAHHRVHRPCRAGPDRAPCTAADCKQHLLCAPFIVAARGEWLWHCWRPVFQSAQQLLSATAAATAGCCRPRHRGAVFSRQALSKLAGEHGRALFRCGVRELIESSPSPRPAVRRVAVLTGARRRLVLAGRAG